MYSDPLGAMRRSDSLPAYAPSVHIPTYLVEDKKKRALPVEDAPSLAWPAWYFAT